MLKWPLKMKFTMTFSLFTLSFFLHDEWMTMNVRLMLTKNKCDIKHGACWTLDISCIGSLPPSLTPLVHGHSWTVTGLSALAARLTFSGAQWTWHRGGTWQGLRQSLTCSKLLLSTVTPTVLCAKIMLIYAFLKFYVAIEASSYLSKVLTGCCFQPALPCLCTVSVSSTT